MKKASSSLGLSAFLAEHLGGVTTQLKPTIAIGCPLLFFGFFTMRISSELLLYLDALFRARGDSTIERGPRPDAKSGAID